jgi:hypothetical protein
MQKLQPKNLRQCTHPHLQIYIETLLGTEDKGKIAVARCNDCGVAVSVLPEPNTFVTSIVRETVKALRR